MTDDFCRLPQAHQDNDGMILVTGPFENVCGSSAKINFGVLPTRSPELTLQLEK